MSWQFRTPCAASYIFNLNVTFFFFFFKHRMFLFWFSSDYKPTSRSNSLDWDNPIHIKCFLIIPYQKTFQNFRMDTNENMAWYWSQASEHFCLSTHLAGSQTRAGDAGFLSDFALLWQAALSKELTVWQLVADGSTTSTPTPWARLETNSHPPSSRGHLVFPSWLSEFLIETQFDLDSHLMRTQKSFLVQPQPKNLQSILWRGPQGQLREGKITQKAPGSRHGVTRFLSSVCVSGHLQNWLQPGW